MRVLGADERAVLDRTAPDVFDRPVDARWSREFFADPRHHLAVALEGERVVAFASGVHYVHPDKPPELFVDEVGVAPTYQGQGIGRRVLEALLRHGGALGCVQAWVLTSEDNERARRLYASLGGLEAAEPAIMYEFPLDTFGRDGG